MTQIRCCFCKAPTAFNCFDALLCAEHFLSVFKTSSPSVRPAADVVPAALPLPSATGAAGNLSKTTRFRVAALSAIQEQSVSSSSDIPNHHQ